MNPLLKSGSIAQLNFGRMASCFRGSNLGIFNLLKKNAGACFLPMTRMPSISLLKGRDNLILDQGCEMEIMNLR
jgi:hypothetical protein